MMARAAFPGCAGFAGVLLLACFAMAPGCGRPPDEAWLQFLGFEQGGKGKAIGVFEDALREESTETVDVAFENGSLNVGQKVGTGVLVNRARIDYRMTGFSPPAADFPVNLYLEAPADGKPVKGTLTDFPLVPTSLKQWIIDTGAFDDAAAKPVVDLTANVTFYGQTDEGDRLETEGGIRITLTNTGGTSSGTLPAVDIFVKDHAAKPSTSGEFRVFRSGSLTGDITVSFSVTGGSATAGIDYENLGTSVTIWDGVDSAIITVIPIADGGAVDKTLTITLGAGATYTLGTHEFDTLTIFH